LGKTALVVQWAHWAAERFPDGQLYVNMRGYDPDEPVPAADALAWFLRALGMAGQDIPPEADDPGRARHHWEQALTLYAELGVPEADEVGQQLAVL